MYIYQTTNLINGKCYIGQSTLKIKESKNYLGSGIYLNRAIKKYGKDNFNKEILIDDIETQEDLDNLEIYFIKEINTSSPNGYNLKEGGNGRGKVNEETKKKMSESHKGKKLSEEHKKKLSKANKGRKLSDETKKKMSETHKGKKRAPFSEEHKKKMSEAHKGQIPWIKGMKHSEATKKKISEAQKGKNVHHLLRNIRKKQ